MGFGKKQVTLKVGKHNACRITPPLGTIGSENYNARLRSALSYALRPAQGGSEPFSQEVAMAGAKAAAVPALLLVFVAALTPLARAQKPTWNDVTFDTSIDRRNNWCPLMAQGSPFPTH